MFAMTMMMVRNDGVSANHLYLFFYFYTIQTTPSKGDRFVLSVDADGRTSRGFFIFCVGLEDIFIGSPRL